MTATTHPIERGRNAWLAMALTLAATGLGHIYCGRLAKGLILFFAGFTFAPIIVLGMQEMDSGLAMAAAIISILLLVALFFYALFDAYGTARSMDDDYRPKEYNRWYIYLMFIVVSLTYPTNLSQSIRTHLLQAFKIPTTSMAPNIRKGDYLLLNKAIYQQQAPRRGDVVIFIPPNQRHRHYIKRVVALPGDTIAVRDQRVWINDRPLSPENTAEQVPSPSPGGTAAHEVIEKNSERAYTIRVAPDSIQGADFPRTRVPNGRCFVLGDNRPVSQDSRHFGPVPLADVLGRVDFVYWPAETWTRFGRFTD